MPYAFPEDATDLTALNLALPDGTLAERLEAAVRLAAQKGKSGRAVFTTSFGMEDQAIVHAIWTHELPIAVVTLDTGRLYEETYSLWRDTEARYGQSITPFYPDGGTLEALVAANGINGFYDSVAARKACCHVRKVEPLGRALEGARVWITGIRADQNASRANMAFVEADEGRGLLKLNPLLDWDQARLDAYVAEHDIPINPLHARGYLSIGCAPCTRAVEPGEEPRAGRWWWENDGEAGGECGLHVGPDGKLVRAPKQDTTLPDAPKGALVD